MNRQDPITPALYQAIFETDQRGAAILEDLIRRFTRPAVTDGGIDAVLKTYERMGMQRVLHHIVGQINRANGVQEPEPETTGE